MEKSLRNVRVSVFSRLTENRISSYNIGVPKVVDDDDDDDKVYIFIFISASCKWLQICIHHIFKNEQPCIGQDR